MKLFYAVTVNPFRHEYGITVSKWVFASMSPGINVRIYFWKYFLNFGVYTDKKKDNLQ